MRLGKLVSGAMAGMAIVACSAGDTQSIGPLGGGASSHAGSGNANGGGAANGNGNGTGDGTANGGGAGGAPGMGGGPTGPVTDAGPGGTPSDAGGGVSDAGAGADSAPSDGFDQFQHRNLDDVNAYRATLNLAPLVLDAQLCAFALAGSQELSQDHLPHQHFLNASNAGTIWSQGFNTTAAENQGDPNGWTVLSKDPTQNELLQIDAIQKAMFDEGPGTGEAHGHYENIMSPTSKRLGVGFVEVNGALYLTNDFSD
jgi:uncharacterized protein YkwD